MDSRRKMIVRTLKDCRLVIVIFSSSYGRKGGSRWMRGREGGCSALAGRGHPPLVDSSYHMAAAAGSHDSWWEQGKQRKERLRYLIWISGSAVLLCRKLLWQRAPIITSKNRSLGVHNRMAWALILIEIGTQISPEVKFVPFLQKSHWW